MHAYASMCRPFRPTAISGHTILTSGHTSVISGLKKAETYHTIHSAYMLAQFLHVYLEHQPQPSWDRYKLMAEYELMLEYELMGLGRSLGGTRLGTKS